MCETEAGTEAEVEDEDEDVDASLYDCCMPERENLIILLVFEIEILPKQLGSTFIRVSVDCFLLQEDLSNAKPSFFCVLFSTDQTTSIIYKPQVFRTQVYPSIPTCFSASKIQSTALYLWNTTQKEENLILLFL